MILDLQSPFSISPNFLAFPTASVQFLGVQLAEDVVDVALHRPHRDDQLIRDRLVATSSCDELEQFQLALAQWFNQGSDCLSRGSRLFHISVEDGGQNPFDVRCVDPFPSCFGEQPGQNGSLVEDAQVALRFRQSQRAEKGRASRGMVSFFYIGFRRE